MRAALLLFAVCAVATGAEEERPRPEAKWLQTDLLHKWVKEMTHTSEIKDDRVIITLKGATKNMIIAEFSDNDSLKLTASWDSSQEDLGDGPIVNSYVQGNINPIFPLFLDSEKTAKLYSLGSNVLWK